MVVAYPRPGESTEVARLRALAALGIVDRKGLGILVVFIHPEDAAL